jgi:hypothetical protein
MTDAAIRLLSQDQKSTITLTFLDPLGRCIGGLKYQIGKEGNIFIRGVSNAKGECRTFNSEIGTLLTVEVACFGSDEMKAIKSFTPLHKTFSAKLVSGKIKETIILQEAVGTPGPYRRKTQSTEPGENFRSNGSVGGTTAPGIAKVGGVSQISQLSQGDGKIKPRPDPIASETSQIPIGAVAGRRITDSATSPPATSTGTPINGAKLISSIEPGRVEERGSNGTPKTSLSLTCPKNSCLTVGMSGKLIEEINIRLAGFGGSVKTNSEIDKFTNDTASAIKSFQRDFMEVPGTGKVCGDVLSALDQFRLLFPINIEEMKCRCGSCGGFGQGLANSGAVKIYGEHKEVINGVEFPGIHRGLAWLFRSALFYTAVKDKALGYSFLKISSGYRCWHDNKVNGRKTYNHMGNALDLQFSQGKSTTRCTGPALESLRKSIFIDRLGANMGWNTDYCPSLETARQGATSWVHVDVRQFSDLYKQHRHYATTQSLLDGESAVDLARRTGAITLLNCGGIPRR